MQISELELQLEEVNQNIEALAGNDGAKESKSYEPSWSWGRKIGFYAALKMEVFTCAEIVDFVLVKEPEIGKDKANKSLSATLSYKCNQKEYDKYKPDAVFYYGPSEWFENEKPREEWCCTNGLKEELYVDDDFPMF